MAKYLVVVGLLAATISFSASPDSYYVRTGGIKTNDAGMGMMSVGVGTSAKVMCSTDAYTNAGKADAGVQCVPLSDGGIPCFLIYYSTGATFTVRPLVDQDRLVVYPADAGNLLCDSYEARN